MSASFAGRDFLHRLFDRLNRSGVYYAVMRNAALLPDAVGDTDIDILAHPSERELVCAVIEMAIVDANAAPIGISDTPLLRKYAVLGCNAETQFWGVRLDINWGQGFAGLQLLDLAMDWPVEQGGMVRVLPEPFPALIGLLKDSVSVASSVERYRTALESVSAEALERDLVFLAPIGPTAARQFLALALGERAPSPAVRRNLRRAIRRSALRADPLKYLQSCLHHEASKLGRVLRPAGVMISVLGVDGAGKSTLIEALRPVLEEATHRPLTMRHLRPGLLPPLAVLGPGSSQNNTEPHAQPPSSWLVSLLRLTHLWLDYQLGYWLRLRPILARAPDVVVYDRYADDVVFDPRRLRIALPDWLRRLFVRLVPQPDLTIALIGDAGAIARRKPELSLAEIERQQAAILRHLNPRRHACQISADEPPEQVTRLVLQHILDRAKAGWR